MTSPFAPVARLWLATAAILGIAAGSLTTVHGEVVITELMIHPPPQGTVEPTGLEFIEIHNSGAGTLSLSNWRFERGIRFTFPDVTLGAGAYLVIAADRARFAERYPFAANVIGDWDGRLSNSGETISLHDQSGALVDSLRYADEGDWAIRRQTEADGWTWTAAYDGHGASLELVDLALPNEYGQNWSSSLVAGGSPGTTNTLASTTSPPIITDVEHYPPIPKPWDFVRVRARALSAHGLPVLQLHYRVSSQEPSAFSSLFMEDDGTRGDGRAGDGVYAAAIPPHPTGTVLEFYVSAQNDTGRRTWPAPIDDTGSQEANALYQVESETDAISRPHYRIVMSVAEDLRFRPETFSSRSNAEMNATFIATTDGQTTLRYQASIRRRGNSSRSRDPRSFRISLPRDADWEDTTEMNLVSQYSFLQTLGMHLCMLADLHAPQAKFVQLRLNGVNYANESNRFGVHYGFYTHLEPLGQEFVDRAFPDDPGGNLYTKVSAGNDRDEKRWGVHYGTERVYREVPEWYKIDQWTKETNSSADDWTDLQDFIVTINEAEGETYLQELSRRINIDQWLRWFALLNLINHRETSLSNGIDDDYSMYRGFNDTRFVLLPHDLDTIFGLGDTATNPDATIFQMIDSRFGMGDATIPQLEPFMNHPEIRLGYFRQLEDLLNTVLAPENFEPLVDRLLPHVPDGVRNQIKTFMRTRRSHVFNIIDPPASVDVQLNEGDGFWISDAPTTELQGVVSPLDVANVRVQGSFATYDRRYGSWRLPRLDLNHGVNHIVIDYLDDLGTLVESSTIDIWRRGETATSLDNVLSGNTVLTSSGSPYRISGISLLPAGASLAIEPGVTLYFSAGARLEIEGQLDALGTEHQRVLFTIDPGESAGTTWNGIVLRDTNDVRLRWTTISRAEREEGSLQLENSYAALDGATFSNSDETYISGTASSIGLTNGVFESHEAGHIRLAGGFYPDRACIIENCLFGPSDGGAPAVDIFARPDSDTTAIQLRKNRFEGGGPAIAVEGNAAIESNRFDSVTAGAAVTLAEGAASSTTAIVAGNEFHRVNEAVSIFHPDAIVLFEHNALHHAGIGVKAAAGFSGHLSLSRNLLLQVERPLVSEDDFAAATMREERNFLFHDPTFHLNYERVVAAFAEQAIGPRIENRLFLIRRPPQATPSRIAEFHIAGPGIVAWRYRLDGGPWSSEQAFSLGLDEPRGTKLLLQDLSLGQHTLEIQGKDLAGVWTSDDPLSVQWIVRDGAIPLVLNRVLAINPSGQTDVESPDIVEIYNRSDAEFSLAGYSFSDDPDRPRKYTFPPDARLAPHGYMTLLGGTARAGEPAGTRLGFSLDGQGDSITLYHPSGLPLDTLAFGTQAAGMMLGRNPASPDTWTLVENQLGQPNQSLPHTPPLFACLNEWYAASGLRYNADYVELYNRSEWPLLLDGAFLTDDRINRPEKHAFAPLSVLPARGHGVFSSDQSGDGLSGGGPLSFSLDDRFEFLTLHAGTDDVIDEIFLQGASPLHATGRVPDGGAAIATFSIPSPGRSNPLMQVEAPAPRILVDWNATWTYQQSDEAPLAGWNEAVLHSVGWESGQGALARETDTLAVEVNTVLQLNPPTTHYFRHVFQVDDTAEIDALYLTVLADDGAVFYLNGEEIRRLRMDSGEVTHTSFANAGVSNAVIEGPFEIDTALLRTGLNLLAASVHQDDNGSSDVVFGARLAFVEKPVETPEAPNEQRLLDSLRITEMMYHPSDERHSEWIELSNTGSDAIQLGGARFVDGIAYTFPELVLAPGAFVLVVENLAAFQQQYGPDLPIAGEYSGKLDNAGEHVALELPEPASARILSFTYNNAWYPETDGAGRSLTIRDSRQPAVNWNDSGAWQAGSVTNGTPGSTEVPVIYSSYAGFGMLDEPLAYTLQATNGADHYRAEGLPAGLVLDELTGAISGTPQTYGSFDVTLSASNSTGESAITFKLVVASSGPLASFHWELPDPSTAIPVNMPTPVTLTARDDRGRIVREYGGGPLEISASVVRPGGSPVLITEIFDGGPDGLEFQNVTDEPVVTTGWRLYLNRGTSGAAFEVHGLDGVEGDVWRFPDQLAPRALRLLTDDDTDEDYIGHNIRWDDQPQAPDRVGGQRGWAAIVDDRRKVVDAVFWGYASEEFQDLIFAGEGGPVWLNVAWDGPGVVHEGGGGLSLARTGSVDTDHAQGWSWGEGSPGTPNPGLDLPVGIPVSLPLSPIMTDTFVEGSWNGELTFLQTGSSAQLHAFDPATGLWASSNTFTIEPVAQPSLAQPLAIAALQGRPFHFRLPFENYPTTHTAGNLPEGLTLRSTTGEIMGTANTPGVYRVTVSGTNLHGTAEGLLTMTVLADDDGDGMADEWERSHGLDPGAREDRSADLDGDGASNVSEFLAGTDPRDRSSRLAISSLTISESGLLDVTWFSVPGRAYQVWEGRTLRGHLFWERLLDDELIVTEALTTIQIEPVLQPENFARLLRIEAIWTGR